MRDLLRHIIKARVLQDTGMAYILSRGLLIGAIVGLAFLTGLLDGLERWGYNEQFNLRGPVPPQTPIVIVSIDEDSFDDLNLQWPWPRTLHGRLLDTIIRGRPAAIGLDLIFSEGSARGEEDDQAFASAIRRAGNVVLAAAITESKTDQYFKQNLNSPVPDLLESAAAYGFVNLNLDHDAFVRSGSLSRLFLDEQLSSFDLHLYRLAVQSGLPHRPLPQEPSFLINFRGPPKTFTNISYYRVLNGEVSPDVFRGKIVLVGATSPLLHDAYPTPFAIHGEMPGIEIHANVLETLMQGLTLTRVQRGIVVALVFIFGLLAVGVTHRFRPIAAALFVVLLATTYIGFAVILFTLAGLWIAIFPVPIAVILAFGLTTTENFIREQKNRALLMKLFARHVSQEVAEVIWEQRDQFMDGNRLRSQQLAITSLFTDLKGFTSLAEGMSPQKLLDWLNNYMETMVKIVIDHGGVIDDYAGDSIKVNFGVPIPRSSYEEISRDAINAVACALEMERELARLNRLYEERQLPKVGMRVGIASGLVVAGSIGGSDRLKYTTIGDTVNIASRLESYDKDTSRDPYFARTRCRVLITAKTLGHLQGQFLAQPLGELELKGKDTKIAIYRVLGRQDGPEPLASLRRTPRRGMQAHVRIAADGLTLEGMTRDVSDLGLCIDQLTGPLTKNQAVAISLFPALGSERVEIDCQVVWSVEDKAGFAFLEENPVVRSAIAGTISQNAF